MIGRAARGFSGSDVGRPSRGDSGSGDALDSGCDGSGYGVRNEMQASHGETICGGVSPIPRAGDSALGRGGFSRASFTSCIRDVPNMLMCATSVVSLSPERSPCWSTSRGRLITVGSTQRRTTRRRCLWSCAVRTAIIGIVPSSAAAWTPQYPSYATFRAGPPTALGTFRLSANALRWRTALAGSLRGRSTSTSWRTGT